MHDGCTIQLLGDLGIPVVKTQSHDTHVLCEHAVHVRCVQLPPESRRALAQTEPVYSGDIEFIAGEARNPLAPRALECITSAEHPIDCHGLEV